MLLRNGFLLLALAAAPVLAGPRVHFGGFSVSGGYARFSGIYPYWYDPLLFAPDFAPGYFSGFAYQPNKGAVKLETTSKNALVYLDGALAGRADKLKQMWLDPGAYTLELRDGARVSAQRIYVLSGKTLKVTPQLMEARP